MSEFKKIVDYKYFQGIHKWSINTTKSNLIGFEKSNPLSNEVSNWDKHKLFVDRYGLMFNYPEDYISIYILLFLSNHSRIYCHPDKQKSNTTLEKANVKFQYIRWLYTEEIHCDTAYNYKTVSSKFLRSVFEDFTDKRGLLRVLWDLAMKNNPKSKLYELENSNQIHQAVICGGNSDVYKCNNYIGIVSDEQLVQVVKLLSENKEPTLEQILSTCQYFIVDSKGEDLGYARQMNIYSKMDIIETINDVISNFSDFQQDLKRLNLESHNLKEYQINLETLERKYGS